jgi:hypothetical protein
MELYPLILAQESAECFLAEILFAESVEKKVDFWIKNKKK